MKPELRDVLLRYLRDYENNNILDSIARAHRQAEKLLLEYLDDAEITEAWENAADLWWYS